MTLPDQELRAILLVRRFLFDLLDPRATPRVPRAIRLRARALVKHYPYTERLECHSKAQKVSR